MVKRILEICTYSVQSAINAQKGGAFRVELCDNMFEGGTTPSLATIRLARQYLGIKLHVMIRPRGGDFCYSDIEFDVMKMDIQSVKKLGADGIVTGILNEDGTIDDDRTAQLADLARPMSVTFHRAFDMTDDPYCALETCMNLGIDRILTSGRRQTAVEGKQLIAELIAQAGDRMIIMPGSGINESNIVDLMKTTGAMEYHLSAKSTMPGRMKFKNNNINMGSLPGIPEYDIIQTDPDKVRRIVEILKEKE